MKTIQILNPVTQRPETAHIVRKVFINLWKVRFADNSEALLAARTVRSMVKEAKGKVQ